MYLKDLRADKSLTRSILNYLILFKDVLHISFKYAR